MSQVGTTSPRLSFMAANLDFLYEGPSELLLDEYLDPPKPYEHGTFFCAGHVRRKASEGLDSDVWECRMPARFYKALLSDGSGHCLGSLSTGSSIGIGVLLSDVCRALARGQASLSSDEASAWSISVSEGRWLVFANENLWRQAKERWEEGSLKFEQAADSYRPE